LAIATSNTLPAPLISPFPSFRHREIGSPPNTLFLGPPGVSSPNRTLIRLAAFARRGHVARMYHHSETISLVSYTIKFWSYLQVASYASAVKSFVLFKRRHCHVVRSISRLTSKCKQRVRSSHHHKSTTVRQTASVKTVLMQSGVEQRSEFPNSKTQFLCQSNVFTLTNACFAGRKLHNVLFKTLHEDFASQRSSPRILTNCFRGSCRGTPVDRITLFAAHCRYVIGQLRNIIRHLQSQT